jgi:hypothetical protein
MRSEDILLRERRSKLHNKAPLKSLLTIGGNQGSIVLELEID